MFVEHKAEGEVKELDEASLLLLKAAALLERRGHLKNWLFPSGRPTDGPMCVRGALHAASSPIGSAYWHDSPPLKAAKNKLAEAVKGDIAIWNNAPERTAEEVISTLRHVALGG